VAISSLKILSGAIALKEGQGQPKKFALASLILSAQQLVLLNYP